MKHKIFFPFSVLKVTGNACLASDTLKQCCSNRNFCDDGKVFCFCFCFLSKLFKTVDTSHLGLTEHLKCG